MTERMPDVSFLMSVYNGEAFLEETLESIAAQTFSNWECIIIDDCSTDTTPELLARRAEQDSRFRVFRNGENLRLPASLNRALSLAQGRYAARVDADDLCTPDRLEKQVAFMDAHPELSLSACKFFALREDRATPSLVGRRTDPDGVRAMLLFTNPILHPGIIARTEDLRAFGYDPQCTCTEDLDLWTRMAAAGKKMALQEEYLMLYRLHGGQITANTMEKQRREVRGIARRFYRDCLWVPSEEQLDMLLRSLYFRDQVRIEDFITFRRLIRQNNRRCRCFSDRAVDSALIEILADYRRIGVGRTSLLRGLLCFAPFFLAGEWLRRRALARHDLAAAAAAAARCGLSLLPEASGRRAPVYQRRQTDPSQRQNGC